MTNENKVSKLKSFSILFTCEVIAGVMSLFLCLKLVLCVNKTIQQKRNLHERGVRKRVQI